MKHTPGNVSDRKTEELRTSDGFPLLFDTTFGSYVPYSCGLLDILTLVAKPRVPAGLEFRSLECTCRRTTLLTGADRCRNGV